MRVTPSRPRDSVAPVRAGCVGVSSVPIHRFGSSERAITFPSSLVTVKMPLCPPPYSDARVGPSDSRSRKPATTPLPPIGAELIAIHFPVAWSRTGARRLGFAIAWANQPPAAYRVDAFAREEQTTCPSFRIRSMWPRSLGPSAPKLSVQPAGLSKTPGSWGFAAKFATDSRTRAICFPSWSAATVLANVASRPASRRASAPAWWCTKYAAAAAAATKTRTRIAKYACSGQLPERRSLAGAATPLIWSTDNGSPRERWASQKVETSVSIGNRAGCD